ncbi:MAG: Hpt domain-containing protein [Clostridia bacterium]|nr:Hpt domain-containing protein [Clostridia bacterium]
MIDKVFLNLYNLLDGDQGAVKEISRDFYNQLQEDLPRILNYIHGKQYADAKKIAHKLKGSVMNFDLPEMIESFITLEQLLASENAEEAIRFYYHIESQIKSFHDLMIDL